MNKFGYVRVATAVPEVFVADVDKNCSAVIAQIKEAAANNAYAVVFPELCVTGYSCGDLLFTYTLQLGAENGLQRILSETADLDIISIVGIPVNDGTHLYNCAAVIQSGKILAVIPKSFLPNYSEYYERRWFMSASDRRRNTVTLCGTEVPFETNLIFQTEDFNFAVEICEDLWVPSPPSASHSPNGAEVIFNCSASNDIIGKEKYREMLVKAASFTSHCAYVYASCGMSESTADTVFSGNCIIAESGSVIMNKTADSFEGSVFYADIDIEKIRADRCKITTFYSNSSPEYSRIKCLPNSRQLTKLEAKIGKYPFVPQKGPDKDERMERIFSIQSRSLAKRIKHIGGCRPVIGISGGLDSTLALLVAVRAMDILKLPHSRILAVTMPGFGTTGRTYNNAVKLIKLLGAELREISIKDSCLQHFKDIGHDEDKLDVTYENAQARERTQILMDLANMVNGIVVGTGDLSEMALGWSTYAGDHISMYCVNCGVPKTLVRHLVERISHTLEDKEAEDVLSDILDTPISPELLPADNGSISQKTEEILGDYAVHDFILYYFLRFGFTPEKILFLAKAAFGKEYNDDQLKKCLKVFFKRFFANQFKRSCTPEGPKIGSVSLSPRTDFRMPSDSDSELWLNGSDI